MAKNSDIAGKTASASTVGAIGYAAAGASAAQITTTLATIGSVVGGGMAAGIAITAAAPVVVGTAVWGLFKLFDD